MWVLEDWDSDPGGFLGVPGLASCSQKHRSLISPRSGFLIECSHCRLRSRSAMLNTTTAEAGWGVALCAFAPDASGGFEIRPRQSVRFRLIKETKPLGMALVLSKVNMRSVDPILPLKIQNSNAFNGFLAVVGCFRALLSRTTSGVLSCAPRTRRHAGCGSYHRYTPQTAPPRPVWPQI